MAGRPLLMTVPPLPKTRIGHRAWEPELFSKQLAEEELEGGLHLPFCMC